MAVDQVDFAKKWSVVSLPQANPAAGADWTVTVPAGQVWRVKAVSGTLAASAAAATRLPNYEFLDASGNVLAVVPFAAAGVVATATTLIVAAVKGQISTGTVKESSRGVQTAILPEVDLPEGFVIRSSTFQIQSGDQWSLVALLVEQAYAL